VGGSELDLAGQASPTSKPVAFDNSLAPYASLLLLSIDQAMTVRLRTVLAIELAFDEEPFDSTHSEHVIPDPACQTLSTGLNCGMNNAFSPEATLGTSELYTQSDDQFGLTQHEIVNIYDRIMIEVPLPDVAGLEHRTLARNVPNAVARHHDGDSIRQRALFSENEQEGELEAYLQSAEISTTNGADPVTIASTPEVMLVSALLGHPSKNQPKALFNIIRSDPLYPQFVNFLKNNEFHNDYMIEDFSGATDLGAVRRHYINKLNQEIIDLEFLT
jgi:hypothetical protein